MQRLHQFFESSINTLFGSPSAKSKGLEVKIYAEVDARMGAMDEMAEELRALTLIFINRDKKNRQEKEKLQSVLSKPEYAAALKRIQSKRSEKPAISMTAKTDEEIYGKLQELIATYPDDSSDLEEIRNHHALLCEAFSVYLQRREEQDQEYEGKKMLGGMSYGR